METNTWNPTPTQNNTAAYGQQDYSYNVGSTETIILTIAAWVVFGIICCLSRWLPRYLSPPQPELPGTRSSETNEDKGARLEFIKFNLPYRTMEAGDEIEDEETGEAQPDKSQVSRRSLRSTKSLRSIQNDHASMDDTKTSSIVPRRLSLLSQEGSCRLQVCSICLSSYIKGDEVAWSTNLSCPHEYHRECIQNWLMSHEDCPMCRNIFLLKPASSATTTSDLISPVRSQPENEGNRQQELHAEDGSQTHIQIATPTRSGNVNN